MKKNLLIYIFLPLFFLFGLTISGKAQLLLEENFDYPVGDSLGAHGWKTHSGGITNTVKVSSSSITYSGYASSGIGNETSLLASGADVNRTFTAQTTGAVYASFLVNVKTAAASGDYFFHFGQTVMGTTFKGKLFVKSNASSKIAFGTSFGSNTGNYTNFDYDLNTTYLIVLKYSLNSGSSSDDQISVFINPILGNAEPTPTISNTDVPAEIPSVGSIALRQGNSANAPTLLIDGIRVANTWTDAVKQAVVIPTLTITAPVTGDKWAQGSTQTINWTASGTNADLMVEYTGNASDATPTWNTINPSIAANLGTWTTSIPADLPVGDDYKIRITDIPQTVQAETGLLSITAAPAPVATFDPAQDATNVSISANQTISFNMPVRNIDDSEITDANVASLITLKTTDAAGTAVPFTATIDADKKVITINPDADLANEQLYYLAIAPVEGLSNNATVEQSVTFTTAASLAPSLSDVTFTETGPYYAGDMVTINWVSENITNVKIEAWVPSENMWIELFGSTPSDGTETFTIPVDAQYSTDYKLRVSDVATPSVTAESSIFTIIGALSNVAITETAPYYAGDEVTVTWSAKNISTVKIQLLDPATSTWSDLAIEVPAADGSKKVTLPANLPTNAAYKIKVTNELNNTGLESAVFEAIAVVNDLVTLRAVPAGVKVKFAGVATVTYTQAYRNQKFIQDGTAAIVIDDPTTAPGYVSGYNIGDGITNITGKIVIFSQLVEFTPYETTGEHATGSVITPEVRTLESLTAADQSKLIKVENFAFKNPAEHDATGKFVKGKNYEIDGIAKTGMAFRTNYYDADYITGGGYVPVGPISSICIVGQNNAQIQITSRSWADMTIPTVADFMADNTFVLTGENVTFTDMSSNHPTAWEWTFEGGTPATSTDQNPVVTYAAKGTYAVTLKATNASGVSNTVTKTDYISIGVVGIPTTSAVVTIYPNPTSGMLFITNPTKGLQTVEIFNTVGKQVNSIASAKETISVDLSGQDKGMYLVKITNNETKTAQFKKIVVR